MRSRFYFVLMLGLASCTDLSAVTTFSNSRSSLPQVKSVVSQLPSTLDLRVGWALEPADRSRKEALRSGYVNDTKVAVAGVQALNDYMAALGSLASDTAPSRAQADATSIASQLASLKPDNRDVITAAGSLIGKLLEQALDAYRGKKVAEVIIRFNIDVQKLIGSLSLYCSDVFAGYHSASADLHTFYSPSASKIGTRSGSFENAMLSGTELALSHNLLAGKEDAANQAALILSDIGQAHKRLAEDAGKLSSSQLLSDIQAFASDISAAATLIEKLK